jgi:hypothetical protein
MGYRYLIKDNTGNFIDFYGAYYHREGLATNVRNMVYDSYEDAEKQLLNKAVVNNIVDDVLGVEYLKIEELYFI